MQDKGISVVGVSWYRLEQYLQLRAMYVDGDTLPATYQEWLTEARKVYDVLLAEGFRLEKVLIDPVEFPAWCRRKGLPMNGPTRSRYVQEITATKPG